MFNTDSSSICHKMNVKIQKWIIMKRYDYPNDKRYKNSVTNVSRIFNKNSLVYILLFFKEVERLFFPSFKRNPCMLPIFLWSVYISYIWHVFAITLLYFGQMRPPLQPPPPNRKIHIAGYSDSCKFLWVNFLGYLSKYHISHILPFITFLKNDIKV